MVVSLRQRPPHNGNNNNNNSSSSSSPKRKKSLSSLFSNQQQQQQQQSLQMASNNNHNNNITMDINKNPSVIVVESLSSSSSLGLSEVIVDPVECISLLDGSLDNTGCTTTTTTTTTSSHNNTNNNQWLWLWLWLIMKEYQVSLGLCGLATILYGFSLRGGDLKWSNQHAAELVLLILTSMILYMTSFFLLFLHTTTTTTTSTTAAITTTTNHHHHHHYKNHKPPPPLLLLLLTTNKISKEYCRRVIEKVFVGISMLVIMMITLKYDDGADLEHHGSFNLLLFLLVGSPLLVFVISVYISIQWIGKRRTVYGLIIMSCIVNMILFQRTIVSKRSWKWGLHSKHMDDDINSNNNNNNNNMASSTCRIARHGFWDIPWPDVFHYQPIFDLVIEKEDCLYKLNSHSSSNHHYNHPPNFSRVQHNKLYVNCPSPPPPPHRHLSSSSSLRSKESNKDDVQQNWLESLKECPYDVNTNNSSEEEEEELEYGKVMNPHQWPLQLCRPKQQQDQYYYYGWFVAHVDVLQQFESWNVIPKDIQFSMTQEQYAQPIRLGLIPLHDTKKEEEEVEIILPPSFVRTGGMLSVHCPSYHHHPTTTTTTIEQKHLVTPVPTQKHNNNNNDDDDEDNDDDEIQKLDVHFLMIDSIGRAHTHRILPQTMKTLEQNTKPTKLGETPWMDNDNNDDDDVYLFEFFRFHSIGYNTGPNFGAIFYNEPSAEDAMTNANEVPSIPPEQMIWNVLQNSNPKLITALINELCQDLGYAYGNGPTKLNHHLYLPFCDKEAFPHPTPYGNFEGPFSTRQRCLNGQPQHEHMFHWIENFISMHNHANQSWFLTSIFMEGHEATGELLQRSVDARLSQFLQTFMTSKESFSSSSSSSDHATDHAMNHTLQFLFGDHGLHMGPYAQLTRLGKIENFTPTLMLTVPGWFLRKYPKIANALTINQYRLLSVFDLYNGVASLTTLPEFSSSSSSNSNSPTNKQQQPIKNVEGLFQIQSETRTCHDAKIPDKYCHCH